MLVKYLDEKSFLNKIKQLSEYDGFRLLEAGIDRSKQVILAFEGIEEKEQAIKFTQNSILDFLRSNISSFYYTIGDSGRVKILYDSSNTDLDIPSHLISLINDNSYCSYNNSHYYPKVSIGVTDLTDNPEMTLIRGEESFSRAENTEAGTIAYLFHDHKDWAETEEDLTLLHNINAIISSSSNKKLEDHLILHQQPIVPLFESEDVKKPHFEILTRFYLEDGTFVPPESLFRALEKDKIIGSFDLSVFKRAFEELQQLEESCEPYSAAINVTRPNIANPQFFFSKLDSYQEEFGITPENIWIEISEKCNFNLSPFVTMASQRGTIFPTMIMEKEVQI